MFVEPKLSNIMCINNNETNVPETYTQEFYSNYKSINNLSDWMENPIELNNYDNLNFTNNEYYNQNYQEISNVPSTRYKI